MPRVGFSSLPVLVVTLVLAVGCGSSSPPPPPPEPTVAVSSAVSTSSTSILVTFAATPDASAQDPAQYTLTSGLQTLAVRSVYPLAGGRQVLLSTATQPGGELLLRRTGLETPTKLTASGVSAPLLRAAVALNATQVLLRFADPGGKLVRLHSAAEEVKRYRISELQLTSATLSTNHSAVVLTTAPQSTSVYSVAAAGVFTEGYALASEDQKSFTGVASPDLQPPTLLGVEAADRQTAVVQFSEPLSTVAPSNFTVQDAVGLPLRVTRAVFSDEFRTEVVLTTDTQQDGTYTLGVQGVTDGEGNALNPSPSTAQFAGSGTVDTTPPTLRGVQSSSSTALTVTFSEPVRGGSDGSGAENPANYTIQGAAAAPAKVSSKGSSTPVHPDSPASSLRIVSAKLSDDQRNVTLTTLEQADIQYELSAANIRDLVGNAIDTTTGIQRQKLIFRGTPPAGPGTDSDGDGLSDSVEQAGWTVAVTMADGRIERRDVTSDPTMADTDGDCLKRADVNGLCLTDRDERALALDPRSLDTDGDTLGDNEEYNLILSNPAAQDTDQDGLSDTLEVGTYRTSPLLVDTDGDQLKDGQEVISDNRNPRIADLPVPNLGVGNVDLRLDVRFTATSGQSTRVLDSRSVSSTLTENQSVTNTTSDSKTTEWFVKAGAKLGFEAGSEGGKVTGEVSVEGGKSGSATSSFTNESARASQQEYANSLTTDKEATRDENVTREVVGSTMGVALTLKNAGTIAFTIKNLEITALMQDPRDPSSFVPVATLLPEGAAAAGINVGPLIPERGPFRFSTDKATPSLIEALMRNPNGLIFRIANYDITDELGRNFAFTSQDINDRAAELVIDYAGLRPLERYRVATNSTYDANAIARGITIKAVLEDILRLKHYDAAEDAGLTPDQRATSYSTYSVGGVERIWRVRDVAQTNKQWYFINKTSIDETIDFGTTPVKAGGALRLAFAQDLDGDGLTLAQENLYPSFDDPVNGVDSDRDGVGDGDEVNGPKVGGQRRPWTVEFSDAQQGYQTLANPGRADTDLDGLSDCQELGLCDLTQADGQPLLDKNGQVWRLPKITDPANPDTDGDGIPDSVEVRGYPIRSVKTGLDFVADSDPLSRDSDLDGLSDSREARVGTNPRQPDQDDVLDDDGDGLVNIEEKQGADVIYLNALGQRVTLRVVTDPKDPDTDDDGLLDGQERDLATNGASKDTDLDGLNDKQELNGSPFLEDASVPLRKTDPLKADTDGDSRSDGTEINTPWTVRVVGLAPFDVHSDPLEQDADRDQLADAQEALYGSNPNGVKGADTDGDDTLDGTEVARGTQVLVPDFLVTVKYLYFVPGPTDQRDADCSDGAEPGQFNYNFAVRLPNTVIPTTISTGFNVPDLPVCANNDANNCKETKTQNNGTRYLVHANPVTYIYLNQERKFSLPRTESFTVEGFIQEVDVSNGNFVSDSRLDFRFGGVGATDGLFNGSTVTKGIKNIKFAKTEGTCKMTIEATVVVQ